MNQTKTNKNMVSSPNLMDDKHKKKDKKKSLQLYVFVLMNLKFKELMTVVPCITHIINFYEFCSLLYL